MAIKIKYAQLDPNTVVVTGIKAISEDQLPDAYCEYARSYIYTEHNGNLFLCRKEKGGFRSDSPLLKVDGIYKWKELRDALRTIRRCGKELMAFNVKMKKSKTVVI